MVSFEILETQLIQERRKIGGMMKAKEIMKSSKDILIDLDIPCDNIDEAIKIIESDIDSSRNVYAEIEKDYLYSYNYEKRRITS